MELPAISETTWTSTREAKYLGNRLSFEGWRVVAIPDELLDHEDFVLALRAAGLPLDPPLVYGISWDGTRDSIGGGLFSLPGVRLAFVWPNPTTMRAKSPRDYDIAVRILVELTDFDTWNGPSERPIAVRVVIGGPAPHDIAEAD